MCRGHIRCMRTFFKVFNHRAFRLKAVHPTMPIFKGMGSASLVSPRCVSISRCALSSLMIAIKPAATLKNWQAFGESFERRCLIDRTHRFRIDFVEAINDISTAFSVFHGPYISIT